MLDTRETYPLSDFVKNPEAHIARLKETRTPEVLTTDGRAEAVLLDTETYEDLMEQIRRAKGMAAVRAAIREAKCAGPREEVSEAEIKRSHAIVDEIMAETERLGLYR